jgi:hypothetical protein
VWCLVIRKDRVIAMKKDLHNVGGNYELEGFWERRDVTDSMRAEGWCDWKV